MIVIFEDDDEELNEELLGIEEIEHALENINIKFYIKESVCSNVVLVEFGKNYLEAAKKLINSTSKKISRAIPINLVVKTDLDIIIKNIRDLVLEKTDSGDSLCINCEVMYKNNLDAFDIKNAVKDDLIESRLVFDDKYPKWNIYVIIIGENTGISILKTHDLTSCCITNKSI
jgi:tRNA(Ser,Leu) C12 N-acetylase TAN1